MTRGDELQSIFKALRKGPSYGNSTTHLSKLIPRLEGGGGGGCPVLVFAIRNEAYRADIPDPGDSRITARIRRNDARN